MFNTFFENNINDEISSAELKGIYKILKKEVEAKEENNRLYNVKVAGFPFLRTIEEYDFDFQPSSVRTSFISHSKAILNCKTSLVSHVVIAMQRSIW